MSYLPQTTLLGPLKLLEIYEFYDLPRLFLCHHRSGQHYLALSVEENDSSHLWLYVALSKPRLHRLRTGQLELRDAYIKAEEGRVFKVITGSATSLDTVESISCQHLPAEWLPLAGEYLSASLLSPKEISLDYRRGEREMTGVALPV